MPPAFCAIAVDYDGTLTTTPRPAQRVLDALRELRAKHIRVVLVTGRILSELLSDFPDAFRHFDAIVSENGCVLWHAGEQHVLVASVSAVLESELRTRNVPLRRGSVILALDATYDELARKACVSVGADDQLIRNRDSLMILPAGVSKASGVRAAFEQLGISRHNAIGVGDAENDLALLETCELGVCVSNAVQSLKQAADLVLDIPGGAEMTNFLRSEVFEELSAIQPKRHSLKLGVTDCGEEVRVPAGRGHLFVDGPTGAGKSYLTGLMLERLVEQGYTFCALDMEGDHANLESLRGVLSLGGRKPLPPPEEVAMLLRHQVGSLVLDLSLRERDVQGAYASEVLERLNTLRRECALPHWVFIEEAHVVPRTALEQARAAGSLCLVTYHPDWLPDTALSGSDLRLTVESSGRACLRSLHGAPATRSFRMDARTVPHVRHRRKYADSEVPYERGFTFRDGAGPVGKHVSSLRDFSNELTRVPRSVLTHHATHLDFSRWIRDVFQDKPLASSIRSAEDRFEQADADAFREQVRRLIELRGSAESTP